jgi:hypothetical protein
MPMVYSTVPGATQTSNATPGTANDCFFISPGTRNAALFAINVQGRGAGLTAISGLSFRVENWTSTASSAGTAITPRPADPGMQAAKAAAGYAAATVTSGTGGPNLLLSIGCGAAGPGGWVAPNPDAMFVLEGAATKSLDIFNASGTASLNFELSAQFQE